MSETKTTYIPYSQYSYRMALKWVYKCVENNK